MNAGAGLSAKLRYDESGLAPLSIVVAITMMAIFAFVLGYDEGKGRAVRDNDQLLQNPVTPSK